MREQLTEQEKALERMRAKLAEMIADAITCNNLQVTVLANTPEEPQDEEKKLRQEIDQFGSSIHDLQEEESQSLDYSLLADVEVEEVDKSDDVNHNSILELGHIGPHSKHFSTLYLVGNLEIEPSKPMERCVDDEQCRYILKFTMPRKHNGIPHLMAKKGKM
ncbi:hypothetical protein HAX54_011025 [Datura stramonium]|uniref:Transposase Tnp1/En/Spm-like domain-containing protein n=1 Tax=Datura stramonium TaxID=4076 RepID=A0ABS8RXM3_DATST|nr:hypothetical protein [Datura stramonium]